MRAGGMIEAYKEKSTRPPFFPVPFFFLQGWLYVGAFVKPRLDRGLRLTHEDVALVVDTYQREETINEASRKRYMRVLASV